MKLIWNDLLHANFRYGEVYGDRAGTSGCELYDASLLCTNVYPNVTLTE